MVWSSARRGAPVSPGEIYGAEMGLGKMKRKKMQG